MTGLKVTAPSNADYSAKYDPSHIGTRDRYQDLQPAAVFAARPPAETKMPATKGDVLSILRDPDLLKINFAVGDIIVNGAEFSNLIDYFEEDDITIGLYSVAGKAEYDRDLNQLNVDPAANPPLATDQEATLLHELVHAIVDVRQLHVRRFDDEVAAYLAQLTYMQIKAPGPHVPSFKVPGNRPFTAFTTAVLDVIDQYKLTEKAARISDFDVHSLSQKLRAVADYAGVALDEMERNDHNGVPIKGKDTRALRMALRLAHPPRWPTPLPPRQEIF